MSLEVWYSPSFHGDFRFEPDPSNPTKATRLRMVRPTPLERKQLDLLSKAFAAKGWLVEKDRQTIAKSSWFQKSVIVAAPLEEVGPLATSVLKPGPAVLTAVKFANGRIEVCETNAMGDPSLPSAPTSTPAPASSPTQPPSEAGTASQPPASSMAPSVAVAPAEPEEPAKTAPEAPRAVPSEGAKELARKPEARAAATVRRPTPCCPDCFVSATAPATEALLSFMTEEQHASWAESRTLVVQGGLSSHRYRIAHRHSETAQAQKRITMDLDDGKILHFHDWLVPPEEEVLAAMLILGSDREPWLRNEATCLARQTDVFKNPFGNGMDGVKDSQWTEGFGHTLLRMLGAA